ncbi:serine/threonine-protein kinase [Nonomuraea jabiensis]|uniref:non-specific serine/threonine protein kinase n=1 Tax=Nonomuraea jabiensis TaxID=882448 RepID=A0A7W9G9N6_9ACTN|nr:serine/threonine-protein kinase [Nonomuraea jabiensis]MBB5779767.1 serine/threonine protein kinase [Nonomuraea jabiensis]
MSDRKQEGRRIAGRYQLQEPIGRGGMGIVWRAYDELLDRTVAVKEVRYAAALGEEVQLLNRRTMREARAAARFEHPNVIVVHDVIEEDDRPWIVMQLVQSRSLGAVIKQDGPLAPKRVAEIGLAVLDALHRAHEAGVLHRDVKPENVLLADDGRVVLTDFGIATLETETQLTVTGLAGTPAFIAPERLKGLPARRESDLWSLGATLYTAVEGRSPHERGMALATMHAVLTDEPDPAPHAGPLTDVIMGLLNKEPVQRLTYEEAQRMLRQVIAQASPPPTAQFPAAQTIRVPRPTTPPPPKTPAPARPPAENEADAQGKAAVQNRFRALGKLRQAPPVEDDTPTDPNLVPSPAPAPSPAVPETGSRITPAPTVDPAPATAESTMDATRTDQRRAGPVIAAAVAVVLVAAIGGYLGLRSAPEDLDPKKGASQATVPTGTPSHASASTSPSASAEPSASQPPSPTATPTATPTPEKEEEKNPLPAGWKMYKDKKLGFSIGLPKGWEVWDRGGMQVKFKGPGAASNAYLMIEEAKNPGKDPYKDWKKQEPVLKNNFGGYKKLDIKRVDGFHKAAADWDFTWNTNTGKTRVRNRGFITENGRAYAIYWHTLKSHWKADYDFFEGFCATFEPAK